MNLLNAIWAESLKIRRSKLMSISLLVACLMPVLIGLALSGSIGNKSQIEAIHDGRMFLGQLGIVVSLGGLIGFGFVFSWMFGREYSDRTVKDLLALPVSRSLIVVAKFIVAALWCAILAMIFFGFGCIAAWVVQMDGMTGEVVANRFGTFTLLVFMVICLCTPVAWSASAGRGYLTSLGFVVLTIVIAQLGGAIGIADYFPWAIPGLYSGAAGEELMQLDAFSVSLPFITGILDIVGTLVWCSTPTRPEHELFLGQ